MDFNNRQNLGEVQELELKKMNNISFFSILFSSLVFVASCSDKSVPVKNDDSIKQSEIGDEIPTEVATEVFDKAPITTENAPELGDEEDCHGKRMVTSMIEEGDGVMMKVAGNFVIATDNGNSRYNPCDLSGKFKKEGMLVRFTGEVLEIKPGERLFATPFRLKNIVERD